MGMPLTFAAPNGVHYNAANVKQIDVQGYDCAFGILPTHVPTIAILAPGVVTVYEEDGAANKFFASSGTVTVNEDGSVQILAEEAHPLSASAAQGALPEAQAALAAAGDDKAKAEAQIAIDV